MKIKGTNFLIYKNKATNEIITNLLTIDESEVTYTSKDAAYPILNQLLTVAQNSKLSVEDKNKAMTRLLSMTNALDDDAISKRLFNSGLTTEDIKKANSNPNVTVNPNALDQQVAKAAIKKMISFFAEFNFKPSYRFINSFVLSPNPLEYTVNYFMVQDHPYKLDIREKVKSREFAQIINDLKTCRANPKPINTRFEVFFGDPGTGKTTLGKKLTKKCIVCASDMLPVDLMQNFGFDDGKAGFHKSDLWIAMENGESILLDEFNMLPFESLRFFQGLTDGKDSFDYKGFNIQIHPDFKIYATMNLEVQGQVIPLPEPLADRAYAIKEFILTEDDLLNALI